MVGTLLLREYLTQRGISARSLAKRCGFRSLDSIYGWIHGPFAPQPKHRVLLQKVTGIPPEAWDQVQVPSPEKE